MAEQRYSILHKLDAGGMAEVWKGKATSMRGFEKLVAIKRVLPDLAKKDNFINMFLDEARLSLHLNHANVVQTFDIGTSEGAYFIVMEWVDGMNLKGVLESLKLNGERVPVEQAIFIIIEMCKGLHHAHRRSTPDGTPLNIVHRDISPPNLLISREGEIKLVDFGLAKAATQALTTEQGMVKGKFSYLSPEAAWGKVVDERADIFAVGALLWEMLAGRRLFEGQSNKETLLMIRKALVPSLESYNPYVDKELMSMIYKTLAQDPDQRYLTSKSLGQDLSNYLFKHRMIVTSYDIADLVERTLKDRAIDKSIKTEWLDDLGQVEQQLVQFTSLEDLQKMSFRALSEQQKMSQSPILPNAEDPRVWAAEMGLEEEFTLPPVHDRSRGRTRTGQLSVVQTEQHVSHATDVSRQEPLTQNFTPQTSSQMNTSARMITHESTRVESGGTSTILRYVLIGMALLILAFILGLLIPKYFSQPESRERSEQEIDKKGALQGSSDTAAPGGSQPRSEEVDPRDSQEDSDIEFKLEDVQ
jgi:eukaryotic-like serine/threonine-protein kinase